MNRRTWNVCLVGSNGVGKTSLVRRYVENAFVHDFMPTFGVHLSRKTIHTDKAQVDLRLWDLAGDDEFLLSKDLAAAARVQDVRTARASAYILVADVTRKATLEQVIERQERIARDKASKHLPAVPFVLALNKSDLSRWEFDELEVRSLVPGWQIIPTSAKTSEGVTRMFEMIAFTLLDQPDDSDY